jgi:transposase
MATELVSMSRTEIDRLDVIRRVLERRLTQVKAAQLLGLGPRQVGRLCAAYERRGALGLVSRQRGKTSNRRLPEAVQVRALDLVRERYADFGPTLAREKLRELHGVDVARETLRKWMARAGIWLTRDKRRARAHQTSLAAGRIGACAGPS